MSPRRTVTVPGPFDDEEDGPRRYIYESDLAIAAFYVQRGFQVVAIKGVGKRAYFRFEGDPEVLQKTLADWVSGGRVEAKAYSEALRNLKRQAFLAVDERAL